MSIVSLTSTLTLVCSATVSTRCSTSQQHLLYSPAHIVHSTRDTASLVKPSNVIVQHKRRQQLIECGGRYQHCAWHGGRG